MNDNQRPTAIKASPIQTMLHSLKELHHILANNQFPLSNTTPRSLAIHCLQFRHCPNPLPIFSCVALFEVGPTIHQTRSILKVYWNLVVRIEDKW